MDGLCGLMPEEEITNPPWGEIGRVITLGAVSLFSKGLLTVANTVEVHNKETWDRHVMQREPGLGLLTVCNHTSTFDDPGVICAMLPWSYFLTEYQHKGVRWSMCAKEICFSNWFLSQFFRSGKVLPVDRKGGVHQPIMGITAGRLAKGDWVHLFPEGRVSFEGRMMPFRRGVGKIVCDYYRETGSQPVVLPFFHSGMGEIKRKDKLIMGVGKHVTVNVGEPIEIPKELCARCYAAGFEQEELWGQITRVIEAAMQEMEASSPPNVDQRSPEQQRHGDGSASVVAAEPKPA